jgi:hypothetical protein
MNSKTKKLFSFKRDFELSFILDGHQFCQGLRMSGTNSEQRLVR